MVHLILILSYLICSLFAPVYESAVVPLTPSTDKKHAGFRRSCAGATSPASPRTILVYWADWLGTCTVRGEST